MDENSIGFEALITRYREYATASALSRLDVDDRIALTNGSDSNPNMIIPPSSPKFRIISR
jgi:hypothetical protein